ncbi:uncharacterized protein LOC122046504 isoform X2 [Zingiber officinale]|uniref:uncharacterized protein LOC122046504 isoform X2 n=1 Tax=Zingiber officinale TaxID=94328 RepID=UPI001C4C11D6|nr:uncharacterized protein LOC122046504 isoform X2 [Zingiber officinale]
MESPECPVCLQPYDEQQAVPRVLACGHSICEQCLVVLPPPSHALPDALRCPACTQIVPFSRSLGPAALPKNIDLLRVLPVSSSSSLSPSPDSGAKSKPSGTLEYFPVSEIYRSLYAIWKDSILPQEAIYPVPSGIRTDEVLVAIMPSPLGRPWFSRANQLVTLLPVASVSSLSKESESKWFRLSYTARVLEALSELDDGTRASLRFLIDASWKERRGVCKVYGLWMKPEEESSDLYLISETFDRSLSDVLKGESKLNLSGDITDKFLAFVNIGLDLSEAVMGLHFQGIVCGCLTISCVSLDEFGYCHIDFNKVLLTSWRTQEDIRSFVSRKGGEHCAKDKYQLFVSPETLLVYDEDSGKDCGSDGPIQYASDVWSLACILAMLITGDEFISPGLYDSWFSMLEKGRCENFVELYDAWKEKVISKLKHLLLGTQFEQILHLLTLGLSYGLHNRLRVSDIWHCIVLTSSKTFLHYVPPLDGFAAKDTLLCCLVLGNSLCSVKKSSHAGNSSACSTSDINIIGSNVSNNQNPQQEKIDEDLVKRIHGHCPKSLTLEGHSDCVTGLAIHGDFLFSSSFDKTIRVWSLQDFSYIQSLKGHEHRIMAILVLDDTNMPICISGDSGSGIFVWNIGASLDQEPCKKWYEHNDWRYSGIHCLALSSTGYLYTGGGDKSIKVWSLQDYTLSCTMTGHKSIVSSLAVANGVLYSGSWDGTIRSWWLHDHSSLAILGHEEPGISAPILSISIENNFLLSAHENGILKVWRNDELFKSQQIHNGAIFALNLDKGSIFTGGWDRIIHLQVLSENELEAEVSTIGSINCDSVVTCLLYWHGRLFAGLSNKDIKEVSIGSSMSNLPC